MHMQAFRHGQCFVTDLSSLSDFAPRGLPDGAAPEDATYAQVLDAWEAWALDEVEALFGVRPAKASDTLVVVLSAIQKHWEQRVH